MCKPIIIFSSEDWVWMSKKINGALADVNSVQVKVRYEKGGYLSEEDKKVGEMKRELFLNMMADLIRRYGSQVLK